MLLSTCFGRSRFTAHHRPAGSRDHCIDPQRDHKGTTSRRQDETHAAWRPRVCAWNLNNFASSLKNRRIVVVDVIISPSVPMRVGKLVPPERCSLRELTVRGSSLHHNKPLDGFFSSMQPLPPLTCNFLHRRFSFFLLRMRLLQRSFGFEYEIVVRNAPNIGLMSSVVVFLSEQRTPSL